MLYSKYFLVEFLLQNVLKKSLKSVEENLIDIKSSTEIEKNMLDTYMNKLYTKYMQSIEEVLKKFKVNFICKSFFSLLISHFF